MLVPVSKTAFVSVCTLPIAIFLVSSNLLSCHDGGGVEKAVEEVAEERKGAQRERSRQAKQAQPVG
jgi:hypothetical protein